MHTCARLDPAVTTLLARSKSWATKGAKGRCAKGSEGLAGTGWRAPAEAHPLQAAVPAGLGTGKCCEGD